MGKKEDKAKVEAKKLRQASKQQKAASKRIKVMSSIHCTPWITDTSKKEVGEDLTAAIAEYSKR